VLRDRLSQPDNGGPMDPRIVPHQTWSGYVLRTAISTVLIRLSIYPVSPLSSDAASANLISRLSTVEPRHREKF
jgi:hypothetical protein